LAVTDWRLRRWRLWFLALMTATRKRAHLDSMVVGVRHDNVFVPSEAEAVGTVELAFGRAHLTELEADLHRYQLAARVPGMGV